MVKVAEGEARTGDRFILASDALAQWFLRAWENGGTPWEVLRVTPSDIARTVEHLRETGGLRKDDTTALVVTIGPENRPG